MTLLMWRMLAEAEQMIVFIQRGELAEEKRGAVLQFSHTMRRCFEKGISPKQEILSLPCTESPFFDVLEQHYYCNLNELQKLIGTEKGICYSCLSIYKTNQREKQPFYIAERWFF